MSDAEKAFKDWFCPRAHIVMTLMNAGKTQECEVFMVNEMVPPDSITAPLFANTDAMSVKIVPSPGAEPIEVPRPDCMPIRPARRSISDGTSADSTQSTTP